LCARICYGESEALVSGLSDSDATGFRHGILVTKLRKAVA